MNNEMTDIDEDFENMFEVISDEQLDSLVGGMPSGVTSAGLTLGSSSGTTLS